MSGTRSASTKAPVTEAGLEGAALVVCSYGNGASAVSDRLRRLARKAGAVETAAATLFGSPRIEDVVEDLRAASILVVPQFMTRGVTFAALEERLAKLPAYDRIVLCPELGSHPGLAGHLAAYAGRELRALGWRPRETSLLLVGHGSRRSRASQRSTERLAGEIARRHLFADTAAAFLEQQPTIQEAVAASVAERVLAVGFFAEAGRHATRDVPKRLKQCGRPTAYIGPIGTCDWVEALVLDQAMEGRRRAGGANRAGRTQ